MSLTDKEIEDGWHKTFSTSNPYCPCDLKSFTKAVRWAEHHVEAMKRIAGAPVAQGLTAPQMAMLHALLVAIRPEYGAPGSRDVEVGRQQKRIDAALAILAQAAPKKD